MLKVNCEVLRDCLDVLKDEIITVYGEAASGKTTIAKILAIEATKFGKVIFIDTENGFNIERLKQLAGEDYERVIKTIFIVRIKNLEEQEKNIKNLLFLKNVKLIIVDSIGRFYRLEIKKDAKKANASMHRQFNVLSDICNKGVPVLITNQVYMNIDDKKISMVGGDMFKKWSKCLIKLETNPRKFILEKPFFKEELFEIRNDGIFLKR